MSRLRLSVLVASLIGLLPQPAGAGAFIAATEDSPNTILHQNYTGVGGQQSDVTVCVDISANPALAIAAEPAIHNVIATYNRFQGLAEHSFAFWPDSSADPTLPDFETVLLHEFMHAHGLHHPQHANDPSGAGTSVFDATRSTDGASNLLDHLGDADGIPGSADDQRGDDRSLNWYVSGENDPGVVPAVVDRTTMTRELSGLPAGHNFVANGNAAVMAALGYANSESAAHQGYEMGQVQRHLHSEDVATLRLARAGIDGTAGTADDYFHQARYVGRMNNPQGGECRIVVRFVPETSFAATFIGTTPIADGHQRLIFPTRIRFNPEVNWYFTPGANTEVQIVDAPDSSAGTSPYSVQVNVAKAAYNGMSGTPRGEVEVRDGPRGDALTASCRITLNAGSGSCQIVPRALGRRTLTADYLGWGGWDGSSATTTHDVVDIVGFTDITRTPAPSVVNSEVVFAWRLVAQTSGLPLAQTGQVIVKEAADCASPPITPAHQCSATLPANSCTIRFSSPGTRTMQLCYSGQDAIAATTATVSHAVDAGRTTVTQLLSRTPAATAPFEPYTVQLQVRENPSQGGHPQGVVVVSDGPEGDPLTSTCQASLAGTPGETASCVLRSARAGTRELSADFAAQSVWAASSAQDVHSVRDFRIVSHLPAASRVGEAVSVVVLLDMRPFLAQPAPTGTIVVSDGVDECTIVLPASECLWRGSTVGTRALTATWSGGGAYAGGTTAAVTQTVLPAAPAYPRQLSQSLASFPESNGASVASGTALSADGRFVVFSSSASNLVAGDTNGVEDVFVRDQLSGAVRRVSVAADGTQGNSASQLPSISANGRYVSFFSQASTLMPGSDSGRHVYVKDLYSGSVARASSLPNGSLPPQAELSFTTMLSALSADGRYVVFASSRPLAAGDSNGLIDVYVKDMQTAALDLVSSTSADAVGDNNSHMPAISADGRHVAYLSTAGNLVPNFTANSLQNKVFIKDRLTRSSRLVSATASGEAATSSCAGSPSLSADGRFVAFQCNSPNLPANGGWNGDRIFVKDMLSGAIELVSHPSYSNALVPAISGDGRYVVFQQGRPGVGTGVYVRDRQTQTLTNQHLTLAGGDAGGEDVTWEPRMRPAISADGRFVSFQSVNAQLVEPDLNAAADVFVRDRSAQVTARASAAYAGVRNTGDSSAAAISRDGETVVFASNSRALIAGDTNGRSDVFLRNSTSGAVQRVSIAADGVQANGDSFAPAYAEASGEVFFLSSATNLIANDTNGRVDLFAKRLSDGSVRRISTAFGSQSPVDALGPIAVSRDGLRVVFTSADRSEYLGSTGDRNGFVDIVLILRDGQSSSPLILSRVAAGLGNGDSVQASISDDGQRIAFASDATNFQLDGGSAVRDVFVYAFAPTPAGLRFLASSDASGAPGNGHSEQPALSPDGRYVAFVSDASNLVPGDTNGVRDVFVKDLQTGAIERVNTSSSGAAGTGGACSSASIAAGARYVSFVCSQNGLVAGASAALAQFYVKDRVTGAIARRSESAAGVAGDADSRAGARALSDAGLAVFETNSSSLTGLDSLQISNVYLNSHASAQAASTTVIRSTAPAVPRPGVAYAVNIEVSSSGSTPASGQVSVIGARSSCVATLTPGTPSTASCSLTTNSTGAFTLRAFYGGDSANRTSASGLFAVEVPDQVLPGKHTITQITPGNGRLTVFFGFNGVGTPHRDYTARCGGVSVVATSGPIVVQPLPNGVSASCTLTARNDLGMGPPSDPVSATPIANTAISITAQPPNPARVGVAYPVTVAVSSEGTPSPGGEVQVSDGTSSCSALLTPGAPSVGSCALTSTTRGNKTLVASYTGDAANRASTANAAYVAADLPGAPVLSAAAPGNGVVTLTFTAPGDNGGVPVLDYTATCGASSVTAAASPITLTGLANGTEVSCSVSARNALGSSAASNVILATPRTVPGAPTLTGATPGDASATLLFSAPSNDGGSPVLRYRATCGTQGVFVDASPAVVTGLINGTTVDCSVRAFNAAGFSVFSNRIAVTPRALPGAPVLTSAQPGDGAATLVFDPPTNAEASAILDYTASCGARTVTGTGSPLQVPGLANGVEVDCSVTARNATGTGNASNVLPVRPRRAPDAPVLAAVQAGNRSASLVFSAPVNDGGSAVIDYTATCGAQSVTGLASPLLVSGLSVGMAIDCSVSARNVAGASAASNRLSVTPLGEPQPPALISAQPGDGSATLTFTAPSDTGGSAILDYTATCGSQSTTGAASPLLVGGLSNGVQVSCSVLARNAVGSSEASNTLRVTPVAAPQPPTLISAQPGNGSAMLTFNAPSDTGGSAVLDYTATCGAQSTTGAASPLIVVGLANGVQANCSVVARNEVGSSAASNALSVTPVGAPQAPTLISAVRGDGSASLDFTAPSNNGGSPILDYTATCGTQSTTGAASPLLVSGLSNGVQVSCSVTARNAIGSSPASNALSTTPATVPAAPLLGSLIALANGVRVVFSAPGNNGGSALLDYELSCLPGPITAVGAGSPIDLLGLTPQQTYRCRVRARNAMGLGAFSAEGSVIPGQPGTSADLVISKTNNSDYINDAEPVPYLITVRNDGPSAVLGARVEDALAPDFVSAQWQCEADAAAWCPPSGSGALDIRVDLPAQTSVRIRFNATPAVVGGSTSISNIATITPPVGINDPQLTNNAAMDGPDARRMFRDGFEARPVVPAVEDSYSP
ncbi:MAG: PD40 domain-containing protein [Xanthomonadales bacterium]|nr:PD40 domain-containing protein [Xanthomonadales bacterium]